MGLYFRIGHGKLWLSGMLMSCLLLGAMGYHAAFAQPNSQKHILMLYAYGYGGRGVELLSDGFFKTITEAGFSCSNVHAEYLDLQRNKEVPGYRQELLDVLHKKYANRQIDLVITLQQPALDFLLMEGKDIAPQAPVITVQNRPLDQAETSGRRIVGELNKFDIKGTLERALELFPQTQRVVFASGSSEADVAVAAEAAHMSEPWRGRLEFEYTIGMSLDDILKRVGTLPPHSLVIFTQYNRDANGRVALAYEAESMIIKAANAPVFGFYDYNLRNGGIGGSVIAVEASGARTGRLALDYLNGTSLGSEGTLRVVENIPMFDWQQVKRWGGDADALPANTVFVNRPPSMWQQYARVIVGTVLFILVQSVLIAVLYNNIRLRRRAEVVLAASEQRFRRLFHEAPVPLCFVNKDGVLVDFNARFVQTFGYTPEDVPTLAAWWPLAYPDPAYRAWVLETWNAALGRSLTAGADVEPIEYKVTCKNGAVRDVVISGIVIGDDFLATFFDVTERKQAELEIVRLNVDLERRVQERTAELTAANRELDSFAYAVSHDLRAPLRAMSGFSQALVEDFGDKLPDEARDYLAEISKASSKMWLLIDGILTLSRSTRGQLQREVLDLSLVAERILDDLSSAEPQRDLDRMIEPGLEVRGDARMLEAVMQNLLENAWKYTAKAEIPQIRVYSERKDDARWFCVADNGAGFDMAHSENLFKPFQRLHRQEEFPGLGIGLATVQRIIHRHGGAIQADAAPGRGAVFCFRLPETGSEQGGSV